MSTLPFEAFIDLVQFDQAIHKTIKNIDARKQELAQQQEQKQVFQDELDQLKSAVNDAQKQVHDKELEMKKLDARETDIKTKLDDVENAKQYSALKKELDAVQKEQLAHEDTLVAAWNQLETAQRTLSQKQDAAQEKISQMDTKLDDTHKQIDQLQHKLEADKKVRPEKAEQVNGEWLEKYEMMQGRVDNPVVEVVQGGCGGCFYAVPDQELLRLRNRALLQCNSCYRFLYDPQVLQLKQQAEQEVTAEG